MQFPTPMWLSLWEESRGKLVCPYNLDRYFQKGMIAGKELDTLELGPVSIPTGGIMARDPFHHIRRGDLPYFIRVPTGEFPATASVIRPDGVDCARYAAVKVAFSAKPAVRYEVALVGIERLDALGEEEYFGFHVEAGMACICDCAVGEAFCDFMDQWQLEHPGETLYDGYFSRLLQQSYREHPTYQREGGDWLNWTVPGTGYHLPIFQSGFGDGSYPIHYGFAPDGSICQLMIQFIDIELAYGGQLQPYMS